VVYNCNEENVKELKNIIIILIVFVRWSMMAEVIIITSDTITKQKKGQSIHCILSSERSFE